MTEIERQNRLLLTALRFGDQGRPGGVLPPGFFCGDSRCVNSTQVPHMAEQPYGCPRFHVKRDGET